MEVLVFAILLGLIPAIIAKQKGRSFGVWWFDGAALFIIALPHALIMKANNEAIERQQIAEGTKKCPHCANLLNLMQRFVVIAVAMWPLPTAEYSMSGDGAEFWYP